MAISDQLEQLSQVKQDIKEAITAKGVSMAGIPFTQYADRIAMIQNAESYPGIPDGYKYVTGSRTMDAVNASATTFPMAITMTGGSYTPPYAESATCQLRFGTMVLYQAAVSGGGWNYLTDAQAYIDVFAACGRSFSTLMNGNQQLSLSNLTATVTVTAWIEPE